MALHHTCPPFSSARCTLRHSNRLQALRIWNFSTRDSGFAQFPCDFQSRETCVPLGIPMALFRFDFRGGEGNVKLGTKIKESREMERETTLPGEILPHSPFKGKCGKRILVPLQHERRTFFKPGQVKGAGDVHHGAWVPIRPACIHIKSPVAEQPWERQK